MNVNRDAHGDVDLTRITHNDGGSWKQLIVPNNDSHGQPYACQSAVRASLRIQRDPVQSLRGLIIAIGNVGEKLTLYVESDTFLSCDAADAGFAWEEVHKDAHLWEFGDSGLMLVMANDE
ncbi:hypothetical protein BGW80DRAFT_1326683 [Lactifluus volemus]|nr:hypothetical protein BGW80DRAFT_1326683 [Lactifluus volemus]